MAYLSQNNKIDLILFVVILIVSITSLSVIRGNSETAKIDLSQSEFSCKKSKKHNNYQGYFNKDNEAYYTLEKYTNCKAFIDKVTGTEIAGIYLKSNNLLVELRLNGKVDTEHHFLKFIYYGLFIAMIIFSIFRKFIRRLVKKYV